MHIVTRNLSGNFHMTPGNDRQVANKQTIRMKGSVCLRGVSRHVLLGQFVPTSYGTHYLNPGKLDVFQCSGALQELSGCRINEDITMASGVDDDECSQTGKQEEKTEQGQCTATDRATGFTLELCGFILGILFWNKKDNTISITIRNVKKNNKITKPAANYTFLFPLFAGLLADCFLTVLLGAMIRFFYCNYLFRCTTKKVCGFWNVIIDDFSASTVCRIKSISYIKIIKREYLFFVKTVILLLSNKIKWRFD